MNLQPQILIVSGGEMFSFYWNVMVLLQYCSFLVLFSKWLGLGKDSEKRIWHFCLLVLVVLYNFEEVCGCLVLFLLPVPANTDSTGVCLHSTWLSPCSVPGEGFSLFSFNWCGLLCPDGDCLWTRLWLWPQHVTHVCMIDKHSTDKPELVCLCKAAVDCEPDTS